MGLVKLWRIRLVLLGAFFLTHCMTPKTSEEQWQELTGGVSETDGTLFIKELSGKISCKEVAPVLNCCPQNPAQNCQLCSDRQNLLTQIFQLKCQEGEKADCSKVWEPIFCCSANTLACILCNQNAHKKNLQYKSQCVKTS